MAEPRVYQRVGNTAVTPSDYDFSVGKLAIVFDGIDDSLSTNSISFTSTDKMSVFAGVRKLSDAANGVIVELSILSTSAGAFSLFGNNTDPLRTFAWSTSAPQSFFGSAGYPAPITVVNAVQFDRSATTTISQILPRINGVVAPASSIIEADTTGNFGNYPLYIGRRNNASLPFNGQLYSMIVVGKAVTAGELSSTEKFVASKTGVTL